MNATYYLVFVDGLVIVSKGINQIFEQRVMTPLSDYLAGVSVTLSQIMYNIIEVGGIFGLVNRGIPSTFQDAYNRVKKIQTGVLEMNLVYIFLMLFLILLTMFYLGGR
jgi:hypothetical protein